MIPALLRLRLIRSAIRSIGMNWWSCQIPVAWVNDALRDLNKQEQDLALPHVDPVPFCD